ncbi:MAG: hypothetical protein IPL08_17315 [Saprospiraceae bacterium]|nr:hypothetical protein [Saprospiraceae bacterium]
MKPDANQSYVRFINEFPFLIMLEHNPANVLIYQTEIYLWTMSENFCQNSEKKIDMLAGTDIQIIGIGSYRSHWV